ncbi:MAG: hypothetical protein AB1640_11130 [bacterium]
MRKAHRTVAFALSLSLFFLVSTPKESLAFWDGDTWKTAAIISGITLGAAIAIVLIAGTLTDIFGEPEDPLAGIPTEVPVLGLKCLPLEEAEQVTGLLLRPSARSAIRADGAWAMTPSLSRTSPGGLSVVPLPFSRALISGPEMDRIASCSGGVASSLPGADAEELAEP